MTTAPLLRICGPLNPSAATIGATETNSLPVAIATVTPAAVQAAIAAAFAGEIRAALSSSVPSRSSATSV